MARPKQPSDEQAAAELDRLAEQFRVQAERYYADEENQKSQPRPEWMTAEQGANNIGFARGVAVAYDRSFRALRTRASRLRNGTAGR